MGVQRILLGESWMLRFGFFANVFGGDDSRWNMHHLNRYVTFVIDHSFAVREDRGRLRIRACGMSHSKGCFCIKYHFLFLRRLYGISDHHAVQLALAS